jgi:hypothetical protein
MQCVTCNTTFASADEHRSHYADEWHKYNLKRKMAALPPVARAAFETRRAEALARQQREEAEAAAKAAELVLDCAACGKHFSSAAQADNHFRSRKHQEREKAAREAPAAAAKSEAPRLPRRPPALAPEVMRALPAEALSAGASGDLDAPRGADADAEETEADVNNTCFFCLQPAESIEMCVRGRPSESSGTSRTCRWSTAS